MSIAFGAKSAIAKWAGESGVKTATLALGSESNRIVIAVTSVGVALSAAPTFNSVSMTLAKVESGTAGIGSIYYLLDASLPGAGSYNVSASLVSNSYGCLAVFYIHGAKQQAPEATAGANGGTTSTPSTNITTVTDNAWVVDNCVEAGGVNGSPNAGQTEQFDDYSTSRGFVVSTKPVASAGLTSLGWTLTSASYYAHALAAFEAYVAPAGGANFFPFF